MYLKTRLLCILFLILSLTCFATDFCLRDSAAGVNDGSDWTDAWEDTDNIVWGGVGINRGDVLYVADGTYLPDVLDLATSGTTLVYIKKAIVADHGPAGGWDNGYGDGVAEWLTASGTVFDIRTDYWEIDGQAGSGTTGHGIKLTNTSTAWPGSAVWAQVAYTTSHVTLKYIEMNCSGYGASGETIAVYVPNRNNTSYWTLQYCYIHNAAQGHYSGPADNLLIEHCYFQFCGSGDAGLHSEFLYIGSNGAGLNCVVRYNIFQDFHATGGTAYMQVSTYPAASSGGYAIYGNVIFETLETSGGSRCIGNGGGETTTDVLVYNNTMYGLHGTPNIYWDNGGENGNEARNNLWYNCDNTPSYTNCNGGVSNNIDDDDAVSFVDAGSGDFHLSAATSAGYTLGSPYNQVMDGIARAVDGVWDRGAYEFDSGATPPSEKLVMVLLSQIQIMPIFWALFSMWAYVVVRIVNKL